MIKKLFLISIVLLFTVSFSFAEGPNMEEGLWEITTKMKMKGMSLPPMTHEQCLTEDDLVPQSGDPNSECEILESDMSGNTVTWTMECTGENGTMTGTGKITYRGDSFKGTVKMTLEESNMQMTSHMNGRRIGDCD